MRRDCETITAYQQLVHEKFTNITSLRLVVNTSGHDNWDYHIADFLPFFPNLTHFRIHVADHSRNVRFSHLAKALEKLPLEAFKLVHCSTTERNLVPLLLCHGATLKKIVLDGVTVESGRAWDSVESQLRVKHPACSLILENCPVAGQS